MKKILTGILALALAASMAVPAFAATNDGTKGTDITVNGTYQAAEAPADVISVTILSEEEHSCRVVVPNNQLSLAIGNKGQNARLAAKLTGWKIDINPETEEPVINFDE